MKLSHFFALHAIILSGMTAGAAETASSVPVATNAPNHPVIRRALPPRRDSIIFIACQGLSLSDLSCYGQTHFQTPNLDRLAAEGTRFTNYRAGGDDLADGQAALMLGTNGPAAAQSTLAARLQRAGYRTGLIGEWSLGLEPWKQGFNDFTGFLTEAEANNYYAEFFWTYAENGVREGTNYVLHPRLAKQQLQGNAGGGKKIYLPDAMMTMMVNFVRFNAPSASNHYHPFFLLVDLPFPHSVTSGRDDYPVPTDAPFGDEAWPPAAKNRAALVTRLDSGIGTLLEQLGKSHLTNEVAIFLTGAAAPEKFADTNLDFWRLPGEVRGGASPDRLRVPMIVRWPGRVPAGRVKADAWSAQDFAPTALDIAGATAPAAFAGVSVLPVLLGRTATNTADLPANHNSGRAF